MKGLLESAMQQIVERPKHLNVAMKDNRTLKISKIAETLKLIERSKALCYDQSEFEREFLPSKHSLGYFITSLRRFGVKKTKAC